MSDKGVVVVKLGDAFDAVVLPKIREDEHPRLFERITAVVHKYETTSSTPNIISIIEAVCKGHKYESSDYYEANPQCDIDELVAHYQQDSSFKCHLVLDLRPATGGKARQARIRFSNVYTGGTASPAVYVDAVFTLVLFQQFCRTEAYGDAWEHNALLREWFNKRIVNIAGESQIADTADRKRKRED